MNILVIAGSGGIGLAIIKHCIEHYPEANIVATYNANPVKFVHERLEWQQLDITDERAIEALSTSIESLDILINAAGFLHSPNHRPEKSIKEFELDFFEKNLAINTLPNIYLAKHFMKSLKSEKVTHFIVLTAKVGSISDNKTGGWLSYRTSKAALNMAIKTISIEWRQKLPNCCILLFHPGTTDTKLSTPFQRNLPAGQLHSPEITAHSLINIIESSRPDDSGKFISFDGSEISY